MPHILLMNIYCSKKPTGFSYVEYYSSAMAAAD